MRKAELFINKKKQAGQSLIEVLIALTVTIVMIVALIAFVLTGLKNAQLAQNQSKATKYAQEALEQIKSLRDRNGSVIFTYSDADPTSIFSDIWEIYMSEKCAPVTSSSGPCYFVLSSSPLSLDGDAAVPTASDTPENQFTRQIIFEDNDGTFESEKKVTVKVKWTDSSGEHESNIQTILTRI